METDDSLWQTLKEKAKRENRRSLKLLKPPSGSAIKKFVLMLVHLTNY